MNKYCTLKVNDIDNELCSLRKFTFNHNGAVLSNLGDYFYDTDVIDMLNRLVAKSEVSKKPATPDYCMHVESDNDWFESPDDICILEDAFPDEGDLKVGAEYEVYASHTYKQKYRVTKVPDDVNDDTLVELVSTEREYFTHPLDYATAVSPLISEIFNELQAATAKFPTWPTHALHAIGVVNEEVGELNKEILQLTYEPHKTTPEALRKEAIQAAAMLIRFCMSLDQYTYTPGEQHSQGAA